LLLVNSGTLSTLHNLLLAFQKQYYLQPSLVKVSDLPIRPLFKYRPTSQLQKMINFQEVLNIFTHSGTLKFVISNNVGMTYVFSFVSKVLQQKSDLNHHVLRFTRLHTFRRTYLVGLP